MGTSLIAFDQAALHTLNFACMLQWRFLSAAGCAPSKKSAILGSDMYVTRADICV